MREFQTSQIAKDSKKKVEKVIDSILKELGMKRNEFDEVKGIPMEMKASGQSKILTPTSIVVVGPEVTVAQPSVQVPNVPYVVVAWQKTLRKEKEIEKTPVQKKSFIFEKAKPKENPKK